VPVDALTLVGADTDITPDAGKTSASRQTFVSGNAARLAGEALRDSCCAQVNAAGRHDRARPGNAVIEDATGRHRIELPHCPTDAEGYVLRAQETYDPPPTPLDENGQGAPLRAIRLCRALAVSRWTRSGHGPACAHVAAHDVGKAINPHAGRGPDQGGIAQGLGLALMEEFCPDAPRTCTTT
jgi:aldehyde oxidoreductase